MTRDMQQEPQDGAAPETNRTVTRDDFLAVDLEAPIREYTKVDCRSLGLLYANVVADEICSIGVSGEPEPQTFDLRSLIA